MKDYKQLDAQHIWHPFTQMKDWVKDDIVVIESGEGCYITDTEGNRYLDGVSSLWCNVHGHRVPELDAALRAQIDAIAHTTFLGLSNVPAIELAEELMQIVPDGLTRVFYSDSGASAVEVALKMGYQYWQQRAGDFKSRKKYIHLTNSYHGDTLGAVSVGGIDLFHEVYKPFLFETIASPAPYCYRCPLGKQAESCQMTCLAEMERLVAAHADELIGVIMEPVMLGAAGMLKQPTGFLKGVRDITTRHNVLLICDEVATGFGRTGAMFAVDTESVTPDLMAVGKGITAGYLPLSATFATEEIFSAFLGEYDEYKTFFHGHTYTGNPLAAAVAVANLRLFRERAVIEVLQQKIAHMTDRLRDIADLPHVGDVRQAGWMVGIELVADSASAQSYAPQTRMGHQVIMKAREKGIMIRPLGDVIVLMPPLALSIEQLDELIDGVAWAIEQCT